MSRKPSSLLAFPVVALLAWGAASLVRPLPERRPGGVIAGERPAPHHPVRLERVERVERVDSLGRGETLTALFARAGLSSADAMHVIGAASTLEPRRLPAGMRVTFASDSEATPTRIVFQLAVDRLLHLTRTDSGWREREERLPWTTDTMFVHGEIASTLYDAFDAGAGMLPPAARAELAWNVADVFEYRLDMSRDLQPGDAFQVLFERARGPQGGVRVGRVLAAAYRSATSRIDAIRHEGGDGTGRFYDQDGKSMQAMFLRAPLEFRRISSVFGMRRHPILGVWRAHKGTDYAAGSGTPVRSVGDGVVVRAGRMSGYGNVVDVRHANGFVSRYGHLRGFARGVRRGSRVSIAQTIGYVGMTGLATAPHLHFEVLVGGVQRNPRLALASTGGVPLAAAERGGFERTRDQYRALMQQAALQLADSF